MWEEVLGVITTYVVRLPDGTVLDVDDLVTAGRLVLDNPAAQCEPIVHYRPCPNHRAYESGNCPACPADGVK
jgi:hypothetical protein